MYTVQSSCCQSYLSVLSCQVHDSEAVSRRPEALWGEDGLIRAGSRQNMRKGQGQRASPPAHLHEALDRQRRLLHGQDLRNYWNLPKVLPCAFIPQVVHNEHPLGLSIAVNCCRG